MQKRVDHLFRIWPNGRGRWIAGMVLAGALVLAASSAVAESSADLSAFLAAYRCDVVERLKMIHADRAPKSRYLVIGLLGAQRGYVQCLFVEDDHRLLCEAESGFYDQKPDQARRFRVTPEALAALAKLGFSTDDSEGNYQRMIDIAGPDDFGAVADVILSALYETYGARTDSRIEWQAPLAPGKGVFLVCAPVS